FQYAMVFPNPVAPRTAADDVTHKAIIRLNASEPMTVLQIQKPWTIVVKSFHPPVRMQDKETKQSVVQKIFGDDTGREIQATALQGVSFAKALRDKSFKPHPFDAYVLHTLYGTLVCVGQFDGPDDPLIGQTQRELESQTYSIKQADQFEAKTMRLFDPMFVLKVPVGQLPAR
ncbi:MAG: hypothetical protein ACRCZF_04530, partial [Gemmataceae bacterium]